ncbi:MAG: hypothetical protein Q4A00_05760 [Flavobacteriaceae bacterium]|nr:hypothetical protein [Flavobacteriaceae bacterium]
MTKIMEISEIFRKCEQKRQTGDYQTLAKVLNTTVDAARMRYRRNDEKAVRTLYSIIEQRDKLIEKYQNQ